MTAFRNATVEDARALEVLFRDSFSATFGHLYAAADLAAFLSGFTTAAWADELARAEVAIRLAFDGDRLVGFAKLAPLTLPLPRRGPAVELRQLYVAESAKGTGIARDLMDWTIATARAHGATELALSVYVDNHRARRFYERYGFDDVGRYTFMVGDHADEDRLMRLVL